jgi:hypothetical protein
MMKPLFLMLTFVGLLLAPAGGETGRTVQIAADGKALLPLVVSKGASAEVKASAAELADYLGRITGAKFEVRTGEGASGLVVGRGRDFPGLKTGVSFEPGDPTQGEDYLLRSHEHGLWILGATDLAVEDGIWDLLDRLGYRQFFPGEHWEVIPRSRTLAIAVDARGHPAYYGRTIWYGFGPLPENREAYRQWCARNRAVQGIELNTGHAYDGILARNKAAFEAHPEYLGLVGGVRKSTKFCISNPGLRELVVKDALAQFARDPAKPSISMEPSDGGGWCECEACAKLGSVTDRALTLANAVAAAVTAKYPGKLVGMYAYNEHSPPPGIRAHPAVVVSIAAGFIRGGFTMDQLLDGWSKRASTLGVREYYSVNPWDHDLPGAARGGNIDYLKQTIPHFHEKAARFLSAESGDNWGPNGLGYYLAARMLWDPREATRIEALTADFLEKAFSAAKEPMRKFYQLLDGAKRQPLSDDLIGRMYRLLGEARAGNKEADVGSRLDDLLLYTRYVELWLDYSSATGADRQRAFESLMRHAWRMRASGMIHTLALWRDLPNRDKTVKVPVDAEWRVEEGRNPWKSSEPFAAAELSGFLNQGITTRKLLDFEPAAFTDNLAPAAPLRLPKVETGSMGASTRGPQTYYTWIDQAPASIHLKAKAGLIYNTRGATTLDFYPAAEPEMKSVAHVELAPDKQEHDVELRTAFTGLHRVTIADQTAGTAVTWNDDTPVTVISTLENPAELQGRWSLYFYVPKGTRIVGGFAQGTGEILNGSGGIAHTLEAKPGYFSVPVREGEDGRLWKFQRMSGKVFLMTVPPCLARNARELLLPAEVVERDGR